MTVTVDQSATLGALIGSFGYDREASLISHDHEPAAVLWQVDRSVPLEFDVEVPSGVSLVCAHLTGQIDWRCESERGAYSRPCLPGTLNITPGGSRVRLNIGEARADVIHFYLPDRIISEVSESQVPIEWIDPKNAEDRVVAEIAAAAARVLRTGGAVGRLRAHAAILELAAHLLERHTTCPPPSTSSAHGGLPPARLRAALERMGDDLQDEPSLLDLAQIAHVSPKHFARAFKQSTGLTAHGWLMRRRMARAQAMLTGGADPIAEIAVACGFADQSHFTAAFRKALGVTPASYRRARLS